MKYIQTVAYVVLMADSATGFFSYTGFEDTFPSGMEKETKPDN